MSAAGPQIPPRGRAAVGNTRTGRPKRFQPPPQSFLPLADSTQPQPIELACLAYHYLLPLFPKTALSLLEEAAATLPALTALKERRAVRLDDIVAEWMAAKQRQWNDKRLTALLDEMDERHQQDERKDEAGSSRESGGLLQRTVSTVLQLLADYSTLRQSRQQAETVTQSTIQPSKPLILHSRFHAQRSSPHPSLFSLCVLVSCLLRDVCRVAVRQLSVEPRAALSTGQQLVRHTVAFRRPCVIIGPLCRRQWQLSSFVRGHTETQISDCAALPSARYCCRHC